MEKFHSSRDEEVEILVPWEGRDVECQTKVACGNSQPAKGTEVTIEDRCETDVAPCHAYMIQSHSQPGKTTDDTSTSHFQASKYYPWFDVINKNYSSLFLVCCRLSQIKVLRHEVKSWGQNLRSVADSHQSLGALGSWLYVTWCVGQLALGLDKDSQLLSLPNDKDSQLLSLPNDKDSQLLNLSNDKESQLLNLPNDKESQLLNLPNDKESQLLNLSNDKESQLLNLLNHKKSQLSSLPNDKESQSLNLPNRKESQSQGKSVTQPTESQGKSITQPTETQGIRTIT